MLHKPLVVAIQKKTLLLCILGIFWRKRQIISIIFMLCTETTNLPVKST